MAKEDDILPGGIKVKKGMVVVWNAWSFGKHPDYWGNPLVFNPERWFSVEENGGKPVPSANSTKPPVSETLNQFILFFTPFQKKIVHSLPDGLPVFSISQILIFILSKKGTSKNGIHLFNLTIPILNLKNRECLLFPFFQLFSFF